MTLITQLCAIVGDAFVLTGSDALPYGQDWMGKYIGQPSAVVCPKNTAQVSEILKLANENKTPVVPVAGNTGLVGGTFAPEAIMVSLHRMNTIREIRPGARIAITEAGVILSKLHEAADTYDLIFPLFFGARGSAMIGGNLSTNAGGSNVLRYGNTRALCLGLEVVLPDGRIMNLMSELHKDNAGYDLKDLFIGAEGTLGIITAAVLKLLPKPRAYATAMVSATSLPNALILLNQLQEATGGMVEAFEYMPRTYLNRMKVALPDLKPLLGYGRDTTILVELGATAPRDAAHQSDGSVPVVTLLEQTLADMIENGLADDAIVARSQAQRSEMWKMRESAAEISSGRTPVIDSDVAVPLDRVPEFLEQAKDRLSSLDPGAESITVCHLGDGNLHYTVWPNSHDKAVHKNISKMIEQLTAELAGSFSAEHGIGLSKLDTMKRYKDPVALSVMHAIKATLDPNNIMNPGKVLPP